LRSQSRWYNEGEKNTKYFLNLEKRNYKQGTISQLRINIDNFINTKDTEISIECLSYFKNLYTAKLTDGQDPSINQFFFPEVGDVHLSKAEETSCEGPLTEKYRMSPFFERNGQQQNSWARWPTTRVLQIVLERYF